MHPWHTIAIDTSMSHWKLHSTCALACGLFVITSMRDCCGCSSAPCCCEEHSGSWGPRPRRPSLLPRGCHHHPPFHPKTRLLPTTKRHHSTAERNIHNAFILIFRTAHQWCLYVCVSYPLLLLDSVLLFVHSFSLLLDVQEVVGLGLLSQPRDGSPAPARPGARGTLTRSLLEQLHQQILLLGKRETEIRRKRGNMRENTQINNYQNKITFKLLFKIFLVFFFF